MATSMAGVFTPTLQEAIQNCKILVVGAGGIGCEILKNLVLCGFPDIEIIDLDTIDLSNLNRQFLFRREHVGKPKAYIARETALKFNPKVKIKAYHDSIMATEYGVNYFKKFDIVLNALDNRAARNHVNRMCLNADVPLVESGTAGYNGQVEVIKKGLTQCYECTPKAVQKTFPGCTIRNTPSEPIHCIVWAKHLFNQLFGESSDEEDISPDVADPEAQVANETNSSGDKLAESGNVVRVNTRQWAKTCKYDAETLFNKFFHDDINYLLSMANLWKKRKPPTPLNFDSVLIQGIENENSKANLRDYHKIWTLAECAEVFKACIGKLHDSIDSKAEGDFLVWDKDDQPAMDFVAACANIRSFIFGITRKSRFEIKSMAGNIIPAIATTNAITAGIVVLHTFKILEGKIDQCKSVYMRLRPNPRNQVIVPEKNLSAPNPDCYVCSAEPAIHLRIDTRRMRVKEFRDEVLIKTLNMVNPDVIADAKGVVVISSEEGETECNENKFLYEMDVIDGVLLKCDDFFQNYELSIIIVHIDAERDEPMFEVIADKKQLKTKEELQKQNENGTAAASTSKDDDKDKDKNAALDDDGPSTSKKRRVIEDSDDDCCIVEDGNDIAQQVDDSLNVVSPERKAAKRKPTPMDEANDVDSVVVSDDNDAEQGSGPSRRKRIRRVSDSQSNDDVIVIH